MNSFISKIGNHIYADDGMSAVKLYKKAFMLEEQSAPWLDEEGLLIHQGLTLSGELFMSVSDKMYLPPGFIESYSADVCPTPLLCVYYHDEKDLRYSYESLALNAKKLTKIQFENEDIFCEVIDKYGVFWHLRLPKDKNASFIPL